jgi:hypothetical protein
VQHTLPAGTFDAAKPVLLLVLLFSVALLAAQQHTAAACAACAVLQGACLPCQLPCGLHWQLPCCAEKLLPAAALPEAVTAAAFKSHWQLYTQPNAAVSCICQQHRRCNLGSFVANTSAVLRCAATC